MKASAGKRVLMLLENTPYRNDNRVKRESRSLVAGGYHVTVIAPVNKPGQPWREVINGVRVYNYPEPKQGDSLLGYLWEYAYSLVVIFVISLFIYVYEGFDVVHTHNPPDTFVLIAGVYKLLGKRFVYDHHDLGPDIYYARFRGQGNRLVYYALVLFEKLSCSLADCILATNQSYKQMEIQRGGAREERIWIVRNGPDLNRVRLVDPDPALHSKAGTILGYVGDMGYHDGVDYLLRALKHLKDDLGRSDFFAVLVGRGDALEELKVLARELGIDGHAMFTGRISDEDLMRNLSTADICICPDPQNSFTDRSTMIKIMEFMTLRKPVVAFDLTEHRFTAQEAALYARPNEELDLARQITVLMDDPERRRHMGQFGHERIMTQLAWTHQEKNLLAAYKTLTE